MLLRMMMAANKGGLPGPPDPNFSDVALLLHNEGANGSATFTDNSPSPKTAIVGAGAVISTAQFKFGSSSHFNNADNQNVHYASHADFGFGSGDFTLECFARASNTSSRLNTLIDTRNGSATGITVFIGGGIFTVPANSIGVSSNTGILATGGTISADTWFHIAITRSGTTLRGFVDGVQAFSVTDARTYAAASTCYIGSSFGLDSFQGMGGYIDEVRITKGVARYTSTFTPPAAPFPDH